MTTLRATLALYWECSVDGFKGLGRGMWSVVALALAFVVMTAVATLVAPLGILGAFILGFLNAYLVGWYLALVDRGVTGGRRLKAGDLRDALGVYFWEVISVLFIFWIAGMFLQLAGNQVVFIATTVATLVFNPVPEMIYSERTQGMALLGDSLEFMQRNWPEWIGGQVIGAGFLLAWSYAVFGRPTPDLTLALIQAFGPWFGFINAGAYAMTTLSAGGFLGSIALLAFTHWFLLFRGHLYQKLSRSSRRSRAWQQRMQ